MKWLKTNLNEVYGYWYFTTQHPPAHLHKKTQFSNLKHHNLAECQSTTIKERAHKIRKSTYSLSNIRIDYWYCFIKRTFFCISWSCQSGKRKTNLTSVEDERNNVASSVCAVSSMRCETLTQLTMECIPENLVQKTVEIVKEEKGASASALQPGHRLTVPANLTALQQFQ